MDLKLHGKTVLVTGGSRGIGAAIVRSFAAEGVGTAHATSRSQEDLRSLKESVEAGSDTRVVLHALDLSDAEQRRSLFDTVGDVDVLINNAGAVPAGSLANLDLAAWREAWELKLWGYIDLTRQYLSAMREHGAGVIINNIGISGERSDSEYIAGSTGNAGLMAFTRAVGSNSLDYGVRVVGVNPGPVETERLITVLRSRAESLKGDADAWREYVRNYPGQRIAQSEEIADLVVFLASERSSYTSGSIFTLDGGMSSQGAAF